VKGRSRRLQDNLALIPLVSISSLTFMKKRIDTRRVGAIFVGLFLTHLTECHANLRVGDTNI
jgi:hypothetical protein